MTPYHPIPGKDIIKALSKSGFIIRRQRGSHVILVHREDNSRRCTVPLHGNKPIKPGTFQSILHGSGLTLEEILRLL